MMPLWGHDCPLLALAALACLSLEGNGPACSRLALLSPLFCERGLEGVPGLPGAPQDPGPQWDHRARTWKRPEGSHICPLLPLRGSLPEHRLRGNRR